MTQDVPAVVSAAQTDREARADGFTVEPANLADVKHIKAIIDPYAARDRMLPRSTEELFEHIREYRVCRDSAGNVVGCVALHIFSPEMAEVRALAVHPAFTGQGIGLRLVEDCVEEARRFGLPMLFTLTLEEGFFLKSGFRRVERNTLTLKVWQECYRCPKFDRCDEIAMVRFLT